MSKKETSIFQLILSLTGIAIVASVLLAAVYVITKEPIEKIKIEKNNAAKIAVLPGFNAETGTLTEMNIFCEELNDSLMITFAEIDHQLFGAAVATYTNKAFNGRFDIMVGFDSEGNVLNTEVLGHHETPGLGDKIDKKKDKFSTKIVGKNPNANPLVVKKDGGDVDAITAATISSRAFCDAVNNASKVFQTALKSYLLNTNNELTDNNMSEKEENYE